MSGYTQALAAGRPLRRHRPARPRADGRRRHRRVLGCYVDARGRRREVLSLPGCGGSVLVLDRDASTRGDRRLIAHLGADEPSANAVLVCRLYLRDPRGRRCRVLTTADLCTPGPGDELARPASGPGAELAPPQPIPTLARFAPGAALSGCDGRSYRLELRPRGGAIPALRWMRGGSGPSEARVVSVREVIAALQSYEPARSRTVRALRAHLHDPAVSVAALRSELQRVDASRIVLNRALREAVLDAVGDGGLSMSEIALRCGRLKYDRRGNASGETSWLARRIGLAPESGQSQPTPWVHSEVLALIAREGLGISPREVELG